MTTPVPLSRPAESLEASGWRAFWESPSLTSLWLEPVSKNKRSELPAPRSASHSKGRAITLSEPMGAWDVKT